MPIGLRRGCCFRARRFFLNELRGGDSNVSSREVVDDSWRMAEKPLLVGPSAWEVAEVEVGLVLGESRDSLLFEERASLAGDGTFLMSWSRAAS